MGLLNLAEMLGSVSEACKVMGYSPDSFWGTSGRNFADGELWNEERNQPTKDIASTSAFCRPSP